MEAIENGHLSRSRLRPGTSRLRSVTRSKTKCRYCSNIRTSMRPKPSTTVLPPASSLCSAYICASCAADQPKAHHPTGAGTPPPVGCSSPKGLEIPDFQAFVLSDTRTSPRRAFPSQKPSHSHPAIAPFHALAHRPAFRPATRRARHRLPEAASANPIALDKYVAARALGYLTALIQKHHIKQLRIAHQNT